MSGSEDCILSRGNVLSRVLSISEAGMMLLVLLMMMMTHILFTTTSTLSSTATEPITLSPLRVIGTETTTSNPTGGAKYRSPQTDTAHTDSFRNSEDFSKCMINGSL